ncbi:MAG: LysR family transcriptional regulator [bacterium]
MRRGLKLSHLRLLSALGDTGQLTQAAAAVGISQPAASRLVAEIERITGHPVHERSGRGIEMTSIGRALALRAQRVQIELDDAARDLAEIAGGGVGHVRIGTVTGAALDRVLPALQVERQLHPNVTIDVIVAASEMLCEQLLSGRLDFALGRIPEGTTGEGLVFSAMETEPVALIARRDHPLLGKGVQTAAAVLAHDWVMPGVESLLTRTVLARLHGLGLPAPPIRLSTPSFLLTLAVLQHSDSIAVVAEATALQFGHGTDAPFGIIPVDLGIVVEPYGMLSRDRMALPPAAQHLAEVIRDIDPGR